MEAITAISIFVLSIILLLIAVTFYVDRQMTKENAYVEKLKKSSYKELKKLFLNENWDFDFRYPKSLFSNNAYYHSGIIRFGNTGYIINVIDWYRLMILQRKIRKSLPEFNKYKKPYV